MFRPTERTYLKEKKLGSAKLELPLESQAQSILVSLTGIIEPGNLVNPIAFRELRNHSATVSPSRQLQR